MTETDGELARRLLKKVLDFDEPWTVDMRLRIATVSQAYASLAIASELRRLNDGRDQWYREVLDLLGEAKGSPEGSLRSGPPSSATGCRVCGNTDTSDGEECFFVALTTVQWRAHWQHFFETALSHEFEPAATRYADERMELDFGAATDDVSITQGEQESGS